MSITRKIISVHTPPLQLKETH